MMNRMWSMRYTIIFGLICGFFLSPILGDIIITGAWSVYDKHYPVVEFKGELLAREAAAVIVRVDGRKLRDCIYVDNSLQSFSIDSDNVLHDAYETKIGDPAGYSNVSRPIGYAVVGTWRVWPVLDTTRGVSMYVKHTCGSHQVVSKIADVGVRPATGSPLSLKTPSIKGDDGAKGDTGIKGDTGDKGAPGTNFWGK